MIHTIKHTYIYKPNESVINGLTIRDVDDPNPGLRRSTDLEETRENSDVCVREIDGVGTDLQGCTEAMLGPDRCGCDSIVTVFLAWS